MNGPRINGEQYDLVVLRVLTHDPYGRPASVEFVYDEQTVSLADGKPNHFITAFVKSKMVKMQMGGNA